MKKILDDASAVTGVYVHEWAIVPSTSLIFSPEMFNYCKENLCGNYNKSWTCPPACDSMEAQREKILLYKNVLVFTTRHELEDSFDYDGMTRGRELHSLLTAEIKNRLKDAPVFGSGSCPVCKGKDGNNVCVYPNPCSYPDKKIGSIEAAGINVTELSKAAGIAYNNGPNTVTFFSMAPITADSSL